MLPSWFYNSLRKSYKYLFSVWAFNIRWEKESPENEKEEIEQTKIELANEKKRLEYIQKDNENYFEIKNEHNKEIQNLKLILYEKQIEFDEQIRKYDFQARTFKKSKKKKEVEFEKW